MARSGSWLPGRRVRENSFGREVKSSWARAREERAGGGGVEEVAGDDDGAATGFDCAGVRVGLRVDVCLAVFLAPALR